ncbi:MAG: hypothetical protein A2992_06270 [Elusimicrobia bacterium RIFCSPLOWO2_01_FULL_59_12]|nr:MAG: hypothetical protein A2992_06270 [Elusimicrobia bacterium RIFCSPLOWO2_01_FULL_59_12]
MTKAKTPVAVDLQDVFRHSSKRLLEEYEITRIALSHRGLKGTVREEALSKFLCTHFPPQFQCTTGEIISTTAKSRQVDLIISHATRMPTLYRSGNIQVVPIEGVLAAVEVKTTLNEGELSKALANIQSVKTLSKTAFFEKEDPHHSFNKNLPKLQPIPGFVFAYESISLKRISDALKRLQRRIDPKFWVDGIFVLKEGYILPGKDSAYVVEPDSESALLSFYLTLWNRLILAWTPPIRLDAYFPQFTPAGRSKGAEL